MTETFLLQCFDVIRNTLWMRVKNFRSIGSGNNNKNMCPFQETSTVYWYWKCIIALHVQTDRSAQFVAWPYSMVISPVLYSIMVPVTTVWYYLHCTFSSWIYILDLTKGIQIQDSHPLPESSKQQEQNEKKTSGKALHLLLGKKGVVLEPSLTTPCTPTQNKTKHHSCNQHVNDYFTVNAA